MGYLHIDNLYKNDTILLFKQCFAMEKIHGTSTHISFNEGDLRFFSGGANHENFINIFDKDALLEKFKELGQEKVIIYGEGYGGKMQGMKETYGNVLKFVAFDVKIGDCWLNVYKAEKVVESIGLEFVHYDVINTDLSTIEEYTYKPSVQAKRNGILEDKAREGVVLRPLEEMTLNNGNRVIVKHKQEGFIERKTNPSLNPDKLKLYSEAKEIADEWVTEMRLTHVLDKLGNPSIPEDTGKVVKAMIEDVYREAEGEIVIGKHVEKAIGKSAAQMYIRRLKSNFRSEN